GVEEDFVIGPDQGEHVLGDRLELAMPGTALMECPENRALDLVAGELSRECLQDLADKRAFNAQLDQLSRKKLLVVECVGHELRRRDEPGRFVDVNVVT